MWVIARKECQEADLNHSQLRLNTLRSLGVVPKDNLFAEKQKGFLVCSVHKCILSVQSNAGQKSVLEESVDWVEVGGDNMFSSLSPPALRLVRSAC